MRELRLLAVSVGLLFTLASVYELHGSVILSSNSSAMLSDAYLPKTLGETEKAPREKATVPENEEQKFDKKVQNNHENSMKGEREITVGSASVTHTKETKLSSSAVAKSRTVEKHSGEIKQGVVTDRSEERAEALLGEKEGARTNLKRPKAEEAHETATSSILESHPLDIRKWGCDREESIFTFVHIGKAGGGNIRPRIAFSALNVTRTKWQGWDSHYYPMRTMNGKEARGKFCTSKMANHRIPNTRWPMKFEGLVECNATTPIGLMVGCPGTHHECGNCFVDEEFCGTVYAGHNVLGSELHWMNHYALKHWWSKLDPNQKGDDRPFFSNQLSVELHRDVLKEIELQHVDEVWCNATEDKVPTNQIRRYKDDKFRQECVHTKANEIDRKVFGMGKKKAISNFAPLYASMPVLRATLMREPWSWFLSKFFWHGRTGLCDDVEAAADLQGNNSTEVPVLGSGWLLHDAMTYLFYICGEDCVSRYEYGLSTLEELEEQAAGNLKQSFAVVGILEEDQDIFFDMLDARVSYFNLTLSANVRGSTHKSGGGDEKVRCKAVYSDPEFRAKMKDKIPVLASLERLYDLGVQVHKSQMNDLRQCSPQFRSKHPIE